MADRHDIVTDPDTATLIKIKAKRLCSRGDFSKSDYEDLQQDMYLHLLEKQHLYDPVRGTVKTFVNKALNIWIAMLLRHRDREKRRHNYNAISLEGTLVEHNGELDELGSMLCEEDLLRRNKISNLPAIDRVDLQDELDTALSSLKSGERTLIVLVAEHGVTGAGRRRGESRHQVGRAKRQVLARFRGERNSED
ncbi:MAG: hypothetical protein EA376_00640 [Phycisphaeraceae bacterium]|nr:MAG: hypothetical protein EA376_00640 [Phycisphaeraceae bacterium]